MAQVRSIVSEALEATVRQLLPSQNGFTEDLQAQNVIVPIIDLTPTAQGTQLPVELQQALAFGNQTFFAIGGTTQNLATTPGFYRVFGNLTVRPSTASLVTADFAITDGLSSKQLWSSAADAGASESRYSVNIDFIAFIKQGETLTGTTSSSIAQLRGSTRQVADVYGNLVNPVGFQFQ